MRRKLSKEFNVDIINNRTFPMPKVRETLEALQIPPEVTKNLRRILLGKGKEVNITNVTQTWMKRTFRVTSSAGRARVLLRKDPSALVLKVSVPEEFDQFQLIANLLLYCMTFLRMRKADLFDQYNASLAEASGIELEELEEE